MHDGVLSDGDVLIERAEAGGTGTGRQSAAFNRPKSFAWRSRSVWHVSTESGLRASRYM